MTGEFGVHDPVLARGRAHQEVRVAMEIDVEDHALEHDIGAVLHGLKGGVHAGLQGIRVASGWPVDRDDAIPEDPVVLVEHSLLVRVPESGRTHHQRVFWDVQLENPAEFQVEAAQHRELTIGRLCEV